MLILCYSDWFFIIIMNNELIIVMLNIKNVAGVLYEVIECSGTLASEVSTRNWLEIGKSLSLHLNAISNVEAVMVNGRSFHALAAAAK